MHPIPKSPSREAITALDSELRRIRSLKTCHRPALKAPASPYRGNSQAYVPQFSARLLNDPGLTDGARRCALKLVELIYRRNRAGRGIQCTVSYLAKALSRSERTIQTYLAQLRERGYIRHEVIASEKARMCIGIFIALLAPVFPRHDRGEWPVRAMKSGVKPDSENYNLNIIYKHEYRFTADHWALKCMDGVFRALMKSDQGLLGSAA
jgi:hypothetical protein